MKENLITKNFKRAFITILIVALASCAIAGAAIPLSLGTQISEASVLRQQAKLEYQKELEAGTLPAGMDWDKYEDIYDEQWEDQLTPLTTANYAVIYGFIALGAVILAWFWVTTAQWLYKSAWLAGMDVRLWTTLGACFNLIAVVVFLAVRGHKIHLLHLSAGGNGEVPEKC